MSDNTKQQAFKTVVNNVCMADDDDQSTISTHAYSPANFVDARYSEYSAAISNDMCTCKGWGCDYCQYSHVDADNDPWSYEQPLWSTATASVSKSCTEPISAFGEFEALPSSSDMGEFRHAISVPAADPPTPSNYSVTYWAEIEYGEQTIQVPIDSENVSGPEKRVIEGLQGMQKVWDWVVEKGLTDKVSLQDAFDLAMDMRGDPPIGFFSDSQGDGYGDVPVRSEVRSRRGPLSARNARLSPTPSDSDCLSVASDILSR